MLWIWVNRSLIFKELDVDNKSTLLNSFCIFSNSSGRVSLIKVWIKVSKFFVFSITLSRKSCFVSEILGLNPDNSVLIKVLIYSSNLSVIVLAILQASFSPHFM